MSNQISQHIFRYIKHVREGTRKLRVLT